MNNQTHKSLDLAQQCKNVALCPFMETQATRGVLIEAAHELEIMHGVATNLGKEVAHLRAQLERRNGKPLLISNPFPFHNGFQGFPFNG